MKLAVSFLLISALLSAQTGQVVTVPAGDVYQAATGAGVAYISPTAGAAILSQKSALNWKSILLTVLSQGTLWTPAAGLSGLISIPTKVSAGLVIAHGAYDNYFQPILTEAQPAGAANIAPVLQLTGTMSASSAACAENSMFATSMKGIAAPLKRTIPQPATVSVGGLTVTFTPQGAQVLKNAAGSYVKKFMVVDVLACLPTTGTVAARAALDTSHVPVTVTDDLAQQRLAKIMRAREAALMDKTPVSVDRGATFVAQDLSNDRAGVVMADRSNDIAAGSAQMPSIHVVNEKPAAPQVNVQQFNAQIKALQSQLNSLQAQLAALSKE